MIDALKYSEVSILVLDSLSSVLPGKGSSSKTRKYYPDWFRSEEIDDAIFCSEFEGANFFISTPRLILALKIKMPPSHTHLFNGLFVFFFFSCDYDSSVNFKNVLNEGRLNVSRQ